MFILSTILNPNFSQRLEPNKYNSPHSLRNAVWEPIVETSEILCFLENFTPAGLLKYSTFLKDNS